MAEFYKVLKADPLGEPWTPTAPGAKPIQNYWCQVEGQDWAVSIGRQTDNPLRPGMHVYGDLMYAKSQKGTEYWKFKGARIPEDVQRPVDDPSTPAQATAQAATGTAAYADKWATEVGGQVPGWAVPFINQISDIEKKVDFIVQWCKKMDGEDEPAVPTEEPSNPSVAGEMDEKTQETLDAIFGGEPEVPKDK